MTNQHLGELEEDLRQAEGELDKARSRALDIAARIQGKENEAKTTAAIADRQLADLKESYGGASDRDARQEMYDLEQAIARLRKDRTQRLNKLETELGRLRGQLIEAEAVQTARELRIKDIQLRVEELRELQAKPAVSDEQLERARTLESRLAELEAERDGLAKQIEAYAPVVQAQRDATTTSGAKELAMAYADQAAKHARDWRRWLQRLVGFSILALVGGVVTISLTHPSKDATNAEIASAIAIDLLVLGLLLYAVRLAAHQFSVHRHLEAVAQAKADALRTFTRIVAGPGEAETRAAVSVALAQAVFESGATGFVDGASEGVTLVERVLSPVAQRASS